MNRRPENKVWPLRRRCGGLEGCQARARAVELCHDKHHGQKQMEKDLKVTIHQAKSLKQKQQKNAAY